MDYFLGFDIGTSGTKVLLISAEGRIVNTVISSYDIKSSHTDWAEQEPSTWWQALKKCINKLNNSFTPELKKVKAIGLSGQMHGAVFMDKKGEPVYPCILWADNRSEKECREIKEKAGQEEIYQITGNPVIPAYTAPKILWFKKNKRKLYEKTDIILMAKDYIGFKLTGNYFTDYSDASGTLLFNIRKKRWSEKIFQELKLDINRHPEIISSLSKAGNLTGKAAQELGLKQGIPVIAGAGDLACGAIGSNNIKEGTATITIGTAGQVVASLNKVPETVTGEVFYFCHGLKNKYFSLASLLSGGLCLKWFKNNISKIENIIEKETGKDAFNILISGIENISPGADGLFFLPYLNGAGTPYMDEKARGVFAGLTATHDKKDMVRSIIEGITFGIRQCLETLNKTGSDFNEINIGAGAAKNESWNRIQADIYNKPVSTLTITDTSALGAAILAAAGSGSFESVEEVCSFYVKKEQTIEPDPEQAGIYDELYEDYKQLYPAFKKVWGKD